MLAVGPTEVLDGHLMTIARCLVGFEGHRAVDNSLSICFRLLRQITFWSHRSGEVISRGSTLSASGDAAASCGGGSTNGAFPDTANRSSSALRPHVQRRSVTAITWTPCMVSAYGSSSTAW